MKRGYHLGSEGTFFYLNYDRQNWLTFMVYT